MIYWPAKINDFEQEGLTEDFEKPRHVGDGFVDDTLLFGVPDPHFLRDLIN